MRLARNTILCLLLTAGLVTEGGLRTASAQQGKPEEVAAKARDIFKANCFECHGGKPKPSGGVSILERDLLVSKDKVVPGKPDDSLLYRVISGQDEPLMPPPEKPRLTNEQVAIIKQWIAAGAPRFPSGDFEAVAADKPQTFQGPIGNEYVLMSILHDVRKLSPAERRYARYFSIAHILTAGATKEELTLHRDALAKAINHLSWQKELVRPVPVETTHTVFRIDLRRLGWDKQPFSRMKDGKVIGRSGIDLFDLALLEYPHGVVYHKSATYQAVVREFLRYAYQVRPIPYVRADWFVSVATQPPLYEDFLQLPRTLKELEKMLGVDGDANVASFRVVRAGMIKSGVSRNNRVVERHRTIHGAYWKSYDFATSQSQENIFKDPVKLRPSGGEMIFNLPNGLQGYFISDAEGNRIADAPTSIVVDSNAKDKIVRNGLACMRCHESGMRTFKDDVRPAVAQLVHAPAAGLDIDRILKLYPEQSKLDRLVEADEKRFMASMEKLLGKPQTVEPLLRVSTRFLDDRLSLAEASAELGLADSKGLKETFQLPQFVKLGFAPLAIQREVPRDAWEDYFDRVVRRMRLGVPVVLLDGLIDVAYEPDSPAPFEVELKTNKNSNTFGVQEDLVILIKPTKDAYVELVFTGPRGSKNILVPATTKVKAATELRYPPKGCKLKAPSVAGKSQITVIASETPFHAGVLLRGAGVADRVVHRARFVHNQETPSMEYSPNPFKSVKKTLVIETR